MIGYSDEVNERPLLPICHITTKAHIEIVISEDGNFKRAHVITNKKDMTTIIPCTEGSAGRAGSKPECHPLCDKLQYIAGDFLRYGGSVTTGFISNPQEPHKTYLEILTHWCQSEFVHPKAKAVLNYTQKGTVVKDLIQNQILLVDDENKLLSKDKAKALREKNISDIFSVISSQNDAFVRWIVESPDIFESRVWRDKTLWASWINFYLDSKEKEPLCFVTGEDAILTYSHPKYILREGDGAKLISSNDTNGFTYRGRFLNDLQACNVSLEVSQKSHYALAWLISRQGYIRDNFAIVAWATSGINIPKPTDDPLSIIGIENITTDDLTVAATAQNMAIKLKKKIAGYGKDLGDTTDVVVMGLDSATPGRMAITFYRELTGSDFLERIDDWHTSCAWIHIYRTIDLPDEKNGKNKRIHIPFIGAPAPSDIAEACYGRNVDEKLRKSTIKRILSYIIDGQQLPRDLVESAVRQASNRIAKDKWEWEKTLSIACALYKKYNRKENYQMALEENRKTRDYLYGRLLALAENLEQWALSTSQEKRATNAERLMQRFAEHPYSTWRTIELSLAPYKARLGGKSITRQRMIDEVIASFDPEDFVSDKRLSGEFLLGYHCQRQALYLNSEKSEASDDK